MMQVRRSLSRPRARRARPSRDMPTLVLGSAVASVVALTACAKQPEPPSIQLSDVGFTLHLPAPMQKALDAAAPGFRAVQASSFRSDVAQAAAEKAMASGGMPAAFATIGDFDHDGATDAVVEGSVPSDSALHVIAILNGAHPKAVAVTQFEPYDADAVGIYLSPPPAGTKAAFEIVAYPDSTLLYQFANGGFEGKNLGK